MVPEEVRQRLYAAAQAVEWKEVEPWAMAVLRVVDAVLATPAVAAALAAVEDVRGLRQVGNDLADLVERYADVENLPDDSLARDLLTEWREWSFAASPPAAPTGKPEDSEARLSHGAVGPALLCEERDRPLVEEAEVGYGDVSERQREAGDDEHGRGDASERGEPSLPGVQAEVGAAVPLGRDDVRVGVPVVPVRAHDDARDGVAPAPAPSGEPAQPASMRRRVDFDTGRPVSGNEHYGFLSLPAEVQAEVEAHAAGSGETAPDMDSLPHASTPDHNVAITAQTVGETAERAREEAACLIGQAILDGRQALLDSRHGATYSVMAAADALLSKLIPLLSSPAQTPEPDVVKALAAWLSENLTYERFKGSPDEEIAADILAFFAASPTQTDGEREWRVVVRFDGAADRFLPAFSRENALQAAESWRSVSGDLSIRDVAVEYRIVGPWTPEPSPDEQSIRAVSDEDDPLGAIKYGSPVSREAKPDITADPPGSG